MAEVALAFVQASRKHLIGEYLPKIRRCLNLLPAEDVWWRDSASSNSAANLVLHLCGNARQWILSGVRGEPDDRLRDEEFAQAGGMSAEELIVHLEGSLSEVDEALAAVEAEVATSPAYLLEPRSIQGIDVSVLDAIYHVVEHFSQHAGQIYYITKMRTGKDLRFWDVQGGIARPNW